MVLLQKEHVGFIMDNKRRLLAVIMCAVMLMAGCGSKKEQKKEANDYAEAANIYEAIERYDDYKKGNYEFGLNIKLSNENDQTSAYSRVFGNREDLDCSVGLLLGFDGSKGSSELKADGLLLNIQDQSYINLDSIERGFNASTNNIGYLPVDRLSSAITYYDDGNKYFLDLIKAAFNGQTGDSKEGDVFVIRINDAKGLKSLVDGSVKYLSENKDNINEYIKKNADGLNIINYLEKLVNENGDEIAKIISPVTNTITKEMLLQAIKELSYVRIEGSQVDVFEGFDEIVKEVSKLTVEDYEKFLKNNKVEIYLQARADKTQYFVAFGATYTNEKKYSGSIDISYKFDNSHEVSLEKPEKIISFSELADLVQSDGTLVENVVAGAGEFIIKAGESLNAYLGTSEPDPMPESEKKEYKLKGTKKQFVSKYDTGILTLIQKGDITASFIGDSVAFAIVEFIDNVPYDEYVKLIKENAKKDEMAAYGYKVSDYESGGRKGISYNMMVEDVESTTVIFNVDSTIVSISYCFTDDKLTSEDLINACLIDCLVK